MLFDDIVSKADYMTVQKKMSQRLIILLNKP